VVVKMRFGLGQGPRRAAAGLLHQGAGPWHDEDWHQVVVYPVLGYGVDRRGSAGFRRRRGGRRGRAAGPEGVCWCLPEIWWRHNVYGPPAIPRSDQPPLDWRPGGAPTAAALGRRRPQTLLEGGEAQTERFARSFT